ncbi:hypothetical protein DXG01_015624 [Tephrocybe rancida]|nr:hypothetical protein DXG01_015624 [Tephrocybe rancida]
MPPSTPSTTPATQSHDVPNILVIVVLSVLGGVLFVMGLTTLFITLRNRNLRSQHSSLGHRHTRSDASSASLLPPKSQLWNAGSSPELLFHPFVPPEELQKHNESTDSLMTVMPARNEKLETPSRDTFSQLPSTFPPHKPALAPLSIPPPSSFAQSRSIHSPDASSSSSSPASSDSESLYSQPSASSAHTVTFRTQQLSPMIPQYAHVRTDSADVPTRANTRLIGKLLKKRARQNERQLTRSISRIERAGSIKPTFDDEDELESVLETIRRPTRSSKSRRKPAVALNHASTVDEETTVLSPTVG